MEQVKPADLNAIANLTTAAIAQNAHLSRGRFANCIRLRTRSRHPARVTPLLSADSRGSLRISNPSHKPFCLCFPLHMSPAPSGGSNRERAKEPKVHSGSQHSVFYRGSPAGTNEHSPATGRLSRQTPLPGSSRLFLFFAAERASSDPRMRLNADSRNWTHMTRLSWGRARYAPAPNFQIYKIEG
jgi:hypothetical protein